MPVKLANQPLTRNLKKVVELFNRLFLWKNSRFFIQPQLPLTLFWELFINLSCPLKGINRETNVMKLKPSAFLLLISSFLLILSSQAANAELPKAFQANYIVKKGSLTLGNLHSNLQITNNRYSYHKYTKSSGLAALLTGIKITENTDGIISGNVIKPTQYLFNQSKRSSAKIDKINFSGNRATGSYKNNAFTIATPYGIQDKASMELSLARDLAANKARLNYALISRGQKSQYQFQKLGNEQIRTPAGTFNAVKVKVVRSGNKRETIFWMAKELGYLPAMIRHKENNDIITTVIRNYQKS